MIPSGSIQFLVDKNCGRTAMTWKEESMEWRVISAGVEPAGNRSEGTAAYRMLVPGFADILGS